MLRVRKPVLTALALCGSWFLLGCAAAPHPVLRENERLVQAIARRDLSTLDILLAPEFRFHAADGSAGDRRAWLDAVGGSSHAILSIDTKDLKLRAQDGRALLCGVQRAVVLVERKPLVDEVGFCDRWEKRGDSWLLTFAGGPDAR